MRYVLRAFVAVCVAACGAAADTTLTPDKLNLNFVAGGPFGVLAQVQVHSAQGWSLATDVTQPPFRIAPTSGAGDAVITLSPDWQTEKLGAGTTRYALTLTSKDGSRASIPVNVVVAPAAAPPKFTYISGPNQCTKVAGLPDDALCTVPGEKPPGNFAPPPPGQSYKDPNFGANVRVLTGPLSIHGYSSPTALSAHNAYAALIVNGESVVVDVKTGKTKASMPVSAEYSFWDADDDDALYYAEGPQIRKFLVHNKKNSTVIDFSKAPYKFPRILLGSRNDVSKDMWVAFWVPEKSQLCALDLRAPKAYCGPLKPSINGVNFTYGKPATWMAKGLDRKSGKRYVGITPLPTFLLYSVNTGSGALDFEQVGPELLDGKGNQNGTCEAGETCLRTDHFDTVEDSEGNQYLTGVAELSYPCSFSLISVRLNSGSKMSVPQELGGGLKRILTLFRCGGQDQWVDWHLGCSPNTPNCVVSTTYTDFNRQIPPNGPIKRTAHLSEIFVVSDNGKEIRRLVEHRSVPLVGESDNSYWTTPRACISHDASLVLADSNFGEPNRQRVILIDTGIAPPAQVPGK